MECRNLIKQVKSIAHIYPGERHFAFKNKLLFAVDKIILLNACCYFILVFSYLSLTNTQLDMILLSASSVAIILLTLALQPFFLTLSWMNMNGLLVITIVVYFILISLTLSLVRYMIDMEWIVVPLIAVGIVLLAIRASTEKYFSRRPLELLI